MALKMRDDRNGRNNKRRKDSSGRSHTDQQDVSEHHVNGDWNEGLTMGAGHEVPSHHDHKRMAHNEVEKRRKDRIKQGISTLGQLLPPMTLAEQQANSYSAERNTLSILERTANFIRDLKEKHDQFLMDKGDEVQAEEIKRLKAELEETRVQRDKYENQLKAAGILPMDDFTSSWTFRKYDMTQSASESGQDPVVLTLPSDQNIANVLSSNDNYGLKSEEGTKPKKGSKHRRKNTISSQLENSEKAKSSDDAGLRTGDVLMTGQDQGMLSQANVGLMGLGQNAALNPQILSASVLGGNMQQGQGQLLVPALNIVNPAAVNAGAINPAAINQGAINPATLNPALMQNFGMDRCNGMMPYMSPNANISALTQNNNAADGFGLLQMAMRDAGITATSMSTSATAPQSAQSVSGSNTAITSALTVKSSGNSEMATSETSSSPLQTLASVATNSQSSSANIVASSSAVAGVSQTQALTASTTSTSTTQAINLNMPIMTPGQCGLMQTFNPNMSLQMMAQGQGMPFSVMQNGGLGGISMMPQQQGQILYLNEQGIPVLSNMPVAGFDGSAMTNSSQIACVAQPNGVAGLKPGAATGVPQMQASQKGQNVLSQITDSQPSAEMQQREGMVQFQPNMLQPQSQLQQGDASTQQQGQAPKMGFNPLQNQPGVNIFPNTGDSTNALLQVQQQQQQLNQQLIQAAQLSGLNTGMNRAGTGLNPSTVNVMGSCGKAENPNNATGLNGENLMLPVSQSGNLLTLNHGQNPAQLPSALILPNGQIIPVVTQPQLLMGQNQQPAASAVNTGTNAPQQSVTVNKPAEGANPALQGVRVANSNIPQVQEANPVSSSQVATTRQTGLLMTTNTIVTAPNRPVSTSVAALTTTVVPTTVTGSIMTTQVQKHKTMTTQGQKRQSNNKAEPKNDGSQNLQPKIAIPVNVSASETTRNSSVIQSSAAQVPMGIDPQNTLSGSSPMTILPNGQFLNNSGAIVLTLPTNCPGQPPTSVLVDPNTMQVLGMLPQQQQATQQQANLPVPSVPTGKQAQCNVQPVTEPGKKSKKGSHRALKPKPPTAKEKSANSQSSTNTSTSISVASTTTASTGQANNESTSPRSNQGTNSASATDISATDILAQAAESIFSDISPSITNFYNPANEDNPLHIDTSAGDTEEDAVAASPKKDRLQNSQAIYNKQSSMLHHDVTDPSTSPYHFVESPPTSKEVLKKSKSKKSSGSVASQKSAVVKKPSKKPSGGSKNSKKAQQNKEKGDTSSRQTESTMSGKQNDDKFVGKQKSSVEGKNVPEDQPKMPDSVNNFKGNTTGKDEVPQLVQPQEQAHPTSEYQQLFSDESSHGEFGRQDTPSVDIPETISFTANELSDVLDQVEKLGNSLTEENPAGAKKSKSRKNKGQSEAGCEEHSSKKKKKSNHDEPDLANTSLSMDSILASISSGTANANRDPKDETSKKKDSESSETLSIHVDEPALHMPNLSSPATNMKSISPSISRKNKSGSELSGVSSAVDSSVKRGVHIDNLTNPLHIVSSPPQSSPALIDVNKSIGSSNTSPTFTSPSLNVNSIHRSSGQKTNSMGHASENRLISNEGNMNEFSFFMPDSADTQVPQGPQSVPCMSTSGVSIPASGSSHSQSPGNRGTATAVCKLPSEQQRLSNSSSLPNVQSSMMSPNSRSVCSSSSPMESSVHHGPQSLPASINNQLTYSAESLFSPSSNCQLNALPDIRREINQAPNPPAPPLMHPSSQVTVQPSNASPGVSRPRTSIYSAENFVQPSMNCDSQNVPKSSYNRPQEDYPQTASSRANPMAMTPESFNFSNIASNVPNNNRGRASSSVNTTMTSTSSSSFSFSLAGNSESTNNSFPPQIGHHQFPFYPLHPSVTTSQGANPESTPETSRKSGQLDHQSVGFPPFSSDPRSTSFPTNQLNPEQSPLNHMGPVPQPFSGFPTPPESTGTAHSDDGLFHNQPLGGSSSGNKVDSRPVSGTSNVRKQKDPAHGRPGMSGTEQQDGRNMERSFVSTGLPSFYTPIRQQTSGPPPLETPPLHHLPPSSNDTRMSNSYQPSMSNSSHQFNSDFSSVRMEAPSVQMPNGGNQNYSQHQQNNPSTDANKHNRQKAKQMPDHHLSRRQGIISLDSQVPSRGSSSRQPPQNQHDHRSSQNPGSHTPTPNTHLEQQQAPTPQQARPQKGSTKQSKGQPARSKKSSKQSFNQDMDSSVTHSLFDTPQGIPSFFPIANLSPPPSRSAQPDGPTYMPHLFGPSSRSLPNTNIGVHKNPAELGGTFNQLFPPVRTQTSLGLNFQPGFGMNPVHGGHGSAAQIKSHSSGVSVTQPMSNFNLTNIFSDVNNCSQSNGGLNISPIKFPHGNAIIPPQPGMDPNTLQHHHQPGMLYHNRTPGPPPVLHNAMSINSLIGHNHPGMGQINNTMGQTFHGYGHPSSFTMPHLNFMHDH